MKDARVRYNPAEKAAIKRHRVRSFCLARRDLPAAKMAACLLDDIDKIAEACKQRGPFVYSVHATRIQKLAL